MMTLSPTVFCLFC